LIDHWYCGDEPPLVGVAVKVTLVPAQIVVADADADTLAGRSGFTVMVIPADVAGEPVRHGLAFEVSCTVTWSLFARVVVVNVAFVSPDTATPFTYHWYCGDDPPLVGVAVKVTLVPAQIVVAVADTDTLAGKFGFTVMAAWALTIPPQPPVIVNIMFALPSLAAVTVPVSSTKATEGSLLDQDPVPFPPRFSPSTE